MTVSRVNVNRTCIGTDTRKIIMFHNKVVVASTCML